VPFLVVRLLYRARPGGDPPKPVAVVVEKAERSASMSRKWQWASGLSIDKPDRAREAMR